MNLGFKAAQGKFTCMLSDDCLVVPGAIANGIQRFEQRLREGTKIGALAFYWRNWPEQDEYWVGLTLGNKMFVNHGLYLTGALAEVGYADEEHYMFYHADGDMCLKLWQAGYCCEDAPDSYVEHYSHANQAVRSSNLATREKDWAVYLKKWEGIFYSPEAHDVGIGSHGHDAGPAHGHGLGPGSGLVAGPDPTGVEDHVGRVLLGLGRAGKEEKEGSEHGRVPDDEKHAEPRDRRW